MKIVNLTAALALTLSAALSPVLNTPLAAQNATSQATSQVRSSPSEFIYGPDQVIASFDMPHIAAIAEANGFKIVPENSDSEDQIGIVVENESGEKALIEARVCENEPAETGCSALLIARYFFDAGSVDPANVAAANEEYLFLKLYLNREGTLVAERFVTLDGGVTMLNIALNIAMTFDAWHVVQPIVTGEKSLNE